MGTVITLFIFGIILAVLWGFGFSFTRAGWRGILDAQKSLEWPTTPGKVLSVMVEAQKPVNSDIGNSGVRRTTYRPALQYSFTVNGKTYGSGHRTFNDDVITYSSIEKARAAMKNYHVEQIVQVYYDPSNPRNSVLEPGKSGASWRSLTAGILCLVLGLIPIWIGYAVVVNQSVH